MEDRKKREEVLVELYLVLETNSVYFRDVCIALNRQRDDRLLRDIVIKLVEEKILTKKEGTRNRYIVKIVDDRKFKKLIESTYFYILFSKYIHSTRHLVFNV